MYGFAPPLTSRSMFDELDGANVNWAFYGKGLNSQINGNFCDPEVSSAPRRCCSSLCVAGEACSRLLAFFLCHFSQWPNYSSHNKSASSALHFADP